jgi:hypothetical protein
MVAPEWCVKMVTWKIPCKRRSVDYTELKKLEAEREFQEIPIAGFPVDRAALAVKIRKKKAAMKKAKQ